MIIHFDCRDVAVTHLQENGWKQIKSGSWISKDGLYSASVHPRFGEVVAVFFQEIQQ